MDNEKLFLWNPLAIHYNLIIIVSVCEWVRAIIKQTLPNSALSKFGWNWLSGCAEEELYVNHLVFTLSNYHFVPIWNRPCSSGE